LRNKYLVRAVADGALSGWTPDAKSALLKARWLADRFEQDYVVVRLSDEAIVYRCNAEGE